MTVITPAHDSAATIDAAIRSVREQTFGDWEHVVADDASSDGTTELVRRLAADDPRLRLVISSVNVGPAGARNLALERARGELVAFLDADDRFFPAYLERMVAAYDAAPRRTGIVSCDAWLEAPRGRLPGTYRDRFGDPDGATVTDLLKANSIFVAALCPLAVVREAGCFSTECWGSEDHDLWLRIVARGYEVVGVHDPLVLYRVAEGSVSSDAAGMARTTQATYRRALDRGGLTWRQRRIALGGLRTARAHEAVERVAARRRPGRGVPLGASLQALPALAAAAVTRPSQLPRWIRLVLARPRR